MARPPQGRGEGRIALHSLQRSLTALTIGAVREDKAREDQRASVAMAETEEQFQIDVSGTAGPQMQWQEAALDFTQSFYALEGERDNPAREPQVWFGAVLDSVTPVIFSVCVMQWNQSDDDSFIGARVVVGAYAPDDDVDFRGRVHVTFQGYGTPQDNGAGEP